MCLTASACSFVLAQLVHAVLALFNALPSTSAREADKMASWSGNVAAAYSRKAEGASMHALLTSSPPIWTGSDACFHCSSERWMLRMLSSPALSTLSNSCSRELLAHAIYLGCIAISESPASSLVNRGRHEDGKLVDDVEVLSRYFALADIQE